ncbi:hypothetical protein E4631_25160 [Hymenobacter sp. UV11]|uniref:FG-GAP repeat domain-containing protein n=1 Tax=Hymenobacter sp. UV11 TaxID=1849735 RepID=UPI0010618937|nr:VCBS repeat-containing protein [Hymenobacter sp. UV11]TDN37256.1 hypothetical protein A8B98_04780 [Hymenobacter sp. UV11]TFZ62448.1 hypothetical protein E4631_25160 [Hymenobacter sp. UV11]
MTNFFLLLYPGWAKHTQAGLLAGLGLLLGTAGTTQAQTAATFGAVTIVSSGAGSTPYAIVVADVNGDGIPDLLTANQVSSTAGVLLGTGTGSFGAATTFSTGAGSYPRSIAVADVNGDGKPDLLTANPVSNTAGVLLGTGTGSFGAATTFSNGAGSYPVSIAVADVNGDGKPDLLMANQSNSTAGVLLGTGTGSFGAATIFSTGADSYPNGIAVADVNGDGKPDLLTANSSSSTAGVLLGTGTGNFGAVTTFSTGAGSTPVSITVADGNGDGIPDLFTANQGSNTAGVLLGTGTGSFGAATTFSTGAGSYPRSIAVADVNGDGKPDLLTANYGSSTAGVLLGTGTGSFGAATTFSTGADSYPRSIAVADVNGDSKPDLLTANNGSSTAGVLLNTTSIMGAPLPTQPVAATTAPLVTLYPNPANGPDVSLAATGLPTAARYLEATLLNPLGQVVRHLTLPATQGAARGALPTTGLAAGIYVVRLTPRTAQGQVLQASSAQRLSVR